MLLRALGSTLGVPRECSAHAVGTVWAHALGMLLAYYSGHARRRTHIRIYWASPAHPPGVLLLWSEHALEHPWTSSAGVLYRLVLRRQ